MKAQKHTMRKGQSWSMDIVIAIVVFGFITLAISGFVLLSKPDAERLEQNSQVVIANLAAAQAGCGAILTGNNVNYTNFQCLFNEQYEQFKDNNNIQGDFCVYLEDEQGRVWTVDGRHGWGSDTVRLGGVPCGS